MKKKLNPAKIARIHERRATGETLESLARDFGLSIGTISNALKARAASPRAKAPSKPGKPPSTSSSAAPAGELPTPDDIRRDLADQVRALRADIENAESPAQRASANRLLVSALQLSARMTPPDPSVAPTGMVLVDAEDMRRFCETGRNRLIQLLKCDDLDANDSPAAELARMIRRIVHEVTEAK